MSAPTATAEQRQREALDRSGWGRRFVPFQPHSLSFWIVLGTVLYGLSVLVRLVSSEAGVYGTAYAVAGLIFGLYGVLWWVYFRHIDHYDRLPVSLAFTAFLWGALAAPWAIALTANGAVQSIYAKVFGQVFVHDWGPALTAPFVEETAKGIGFVLLLSLAPQIIRSPRAALLVGAFIGLGFEIFEDALYGALGAAEGFNANPVGAVIKTVFLRTATGFFSHAAYCALFSVGVLYLVGTPAQRRLPLRGIAFILLAMLLHGVWDGAAAIGDSGPASFLAMVAVAVVCSIGLFVAFRLSAAPERAWMREVMQPEVDLGTITPAELDALAGGRKERKTYRHAVHGHHERRRAKHVLEAGLDLSHELAASRGESAPGVEHARAEVTRLRELPAERVPEGG